VHAAAWKRTFDGCLKEVSKREGRPFQPFEIDPDYYRYVDGKPRYAGVDSFLRSRAIIVDNVDWEIPTIPRARKSCAGSGTVRTSCSTKF
jgi:beta-phosphoglucomutase-like phosphatase (HAD superfamily)